MRGFKPDDQRQPQGGNMGHDAVMAAIARQNQQQTAPQAEPPKPESSPMQSLRQIFLARSLIPEADKTSASARLAWPMAALCGPRAGFLG